jgi:hypothetical protein
MHFVRQRFVLYQIYRKLKMSIDVEVLIETYVTLKEYIVSKERQAAADNLVSMLVDNLSDKELKEFSGADSYTKRALEEYLEDEDDEIDYEE